MISAKKLVSILLAGAMVFGLTACSSKNSGGTSSSSEEKITPKVRHQWSDDSSHNRTEKSSATHLPHKRTRQNSRLQSQATRQTATFSMTGAPEEQRASLSPEKFLP